jgi:hypothetical protein
MARIEEKGSNPDKGRPAGEPEDPGAAEALAEAAADEKRSDPEAPGTGIARDESPAEPGEPG